MKDEAKKSPTVDSVAGRGLAAPPDRLRCGGRVYVAVTSAVIVADGVVCMRRVIFWRAVCLLNDVCQFAAAGRLLAARSKRGISHEEIEATVCHN